MAQLSEAENNNIIKWYRINLTKRKELTAFRNIVTRIIEDLNKNEITSDDEETVYADCYKRQYLFPSNSSNVAGYYETIMTNIRLSCWVRCTENELLEILKELNDKNITSDASRKSNSGTIRVTDDSEINTLRWIINQMPQNLVRVNDIPEGTSKALLPVPGGVLLEGDLSKKRGKVDTDKFYFSVLGINLLMIVSKGDAEIVGDLAKEIEEIKKANANDKENKAVHWMALRATRGSEQTLEDRINRWKSNDESSVYIETYLPFYLAEVKKGSKSTVQRKALYCPGYLFIRTSITDLLKIETDKYWDGAAISRYLVRQSMRRKKGHAGKMDKEAQQALKISDKEMESFKFAVDSNLSNVPLDAEDYLDNELVKYYNPGNAFHQMLGHVLHKSDGLYLAFVFSGIMKNAKAIKIESSQIRKLSNKELAELKIKQ